MELIERYLNEVRKHLPAKGREDILAEIKSHLEDTLDERTEENPPKRTWWLCSRKRVLPR